jgi:uncharacterized secreted repeat protein (TIGR03808 family)
MAQGKPDFTRRGLISALAGVPAAAVAAPALGGETFSLADLRGSVSAAELGLVPGAADDQSRKLQAILDVASEANQPVFLPPGIYNVSNITFPKRVRLTGVPGASRLVNSGNGHFLMCEDAEHLELTGISIDGANRAINDYANAALRIANAQYVVIQNCQVYGSTANGLQIERSRGRVERTRISGAAGDCAIYAVENQDFSITCNEIADCRNGGILVHRWQDGEDGTIVSGNRISRIGAARGGTGPWGNGINVFRAHSVMVANNHVADCAFSAIRSNSGSNVQITGNTCLRSGETAVYSEFEFQGALIANNVVDGAAIGISIANFMQGGRIAVVSGNMIRNIHASAPYENDDQFFGIGISAEADTAISGNVIEKAANFGLSLGWGPYLRDVVVSSNVVREASTGIGVTVVEGAGKALISDNIITGHARGAIIGHRWKEAVTGDLALRGSGAHEHLAIERNTVG